MAKEDFCFTYYDGDAARDMAHMNRLERGAYSDIIVSQRKFGHLSLSLIKKTLGNDFDSVWESLEIILKVDAEGKYFIEWLDISIEKMKRQSAHQSKNGSKGGRPKKATENPNHNPNETKTITQENPLENGNGNEIENKNEINEALVLPKMMNVWKTENPAYKIIVDQDITSLRKIAVFISEKNGIEHLSPDEVKRLLEQWGKWCRHVKETGKFQNLPLHTIAKFHMQEIDQQTKSQNQGTKPINGVSKKEKFETEFKPISEKFLKGENVLKLIKPEYYDQLVLFNIIPSGQLHLIKGATIEAQKKNGVIRYLKTLKKS